MADPVPSLSEWRVLTAGKAGREINDCTGRLLSYHATPGTNMARRLELLDQIHTICSNYVNTQAGQVAPLLTPLTHLGLIALKQIGLIQETRAKWIWPGRPLARAWRHRTYAHSGHVLAARRDPTSAGNNWMEQLDPSTAVGATATDAVQGVAREQDPVVVLGLAGRTGQADEPGVQYWPPTSDGNAGLSSMTEDAPARRVARPESFQHQRAAHREEAEQTSRSTSARPAVPSTLPARFRSVPPLIVPRR